jgi:hypothetical protein
MKALTWWRASGGRDLSVARRTFSGIVGTFFGQRRLRSARRYLALRACPQARVIEFDIAALLLLQ